MDEKLTLEDYKRIIDNYDGPIVTKEVADAAKGYQNSITPAIENYRKTLDNKLKPQAFKNNIKTGLQEIIPNYDKSTPLKGQLEQAFANDPELVKKINIPGLNETGKVFGLGQNISEWNLSSGKATGFFKFLNSSEQQSQNDFTEIKKELTNTYEESLKGETLSNAQKYAKEYADAEAKLAKKLNDIQNDTSIKEALNYTVNADGTYTENTKQNFAKAKEVLETNKKAYVDEMVSEAKKKIALDQKIEAFANGQTTAEDIIKMGAEDKRQLFDSIPENVRNSLGINLDEIGDMSQKQIEEIQQNLKNESYLDEIKKAYNKRFDQAIEDGGKYNKIIRNGKATAENVAEKMSSYRTVGKYALGALAGTALIGALFFGSNKGEQTNAQLYGQQPLY